VDLVLHLVGHEPMVPRPPLSRHIVGTFGSSGKTWDGGVNEG
jgi:hypothetical protein